MFSFFKRKKGKEDSLSNLRTVSRWMLELPAGDIYSAQEQVVQNLIQFNHTQQPMTKERLAVLMHLDEHSRDMQFSLCSQYLRNPRMSKVIESRLWTAIHAFYWEITRGYHAFLMEYVSNPGGSRFQASVPIVTARTIRGFADIFKWRYFRYERIEDKLWMRQHNLYRIAEFDGFQDNRFKLYKNEHRETACAAEYLQCLLLSPLGAGSLAPKQIELVDHWLDNWSHLLQLELNHDPTRHFFRVDTSEGHGLQRIQGDAEATHRFIATDQLLEHLELVKRSLKSGATPASIGLGEDFRLPDGYDLLEYAEGEWSPVSGRDRRRHSRHSVKKHWEVIRDLHNIYTHLQEASQLNLELEEGMSPEELLDIKMYGFVTERTKALLRKRPPAGKASRLENVEQWPVQDRSEDGAGVLLPNEDNDWLKVGKLVMMRTEPGEPWQVGSIRRITRIDNEWRKIGIEFLSTDPHPCQIEPVTTLAVGYRVDEAGANPADQPSAALRLSIGEADLLLMESGKYGHGKPHRLRDGMFVQQIRLDGVRDHGDGWLLVTYTVLG